MLILAISIQDSNCDEGVMHPLGKEELLQDDNCFLYQIFLSRLQKFQSFWKISREHNIIVFWEGLKEWVLSFAIFTMLDQEIKL